MSCSICESCFEAAHTTEEALHYYYLEMANYFKNDQPVFRLLMSMAADEQKHADAILESKKTGNHSDKLHEETKTLVKKLSYITKIVLNETKKKPKTFEDVYEFAHEQENDEINSIFIFIITESMSLNGDKLGFMLSSIETHISKLTLFSNSYDQLKRREFIASEN